MCGGRAGGRRVGARQKLGYGAVARKAWAKPMGSLEVGEAFRAVLSCGKVDQSLEAGKPWQEGDFR